METISKCLSSSLPLLTLTKTLIPTPKTHLIFPISNPICTSKILPFNSPNILCTQASTHRNDTASRTTLFSFNFHQGLFSPSSLHPLLKTQFPVLFLGLSFPLYSFASETTSLLTEEVPSKISLESVLVSIDNFFIRYPFFVTTVAFIWLIAIPLTQEYLQKYKFISAINSFKKLKDDPSCQLLDIRDSKILAYLSSPNLKVLGKSAVQVEFSEGDEEGFVKRVLENLGDPANTVVCVVDSFDGNSLKVAELLVKNGFKEAYAIRGGLQGKNGWQEIQETLLPPSVHIRRKIKDKKLKHTGKEMKNEELSSTSPIAQSKHDQRPLSPYPNYPDFKPPSSPIPSKPS